jgi:hypothetical protein
MKTIRMTASSTENARSRIQESAVNSPERDGWVWVSPSMVTLGFATLPSYAL